MTASVTFENAYKAANQRVSYLARCVLVFLVRAMVPANTMGNKMTTITTKSELLTRFEQAQAVRAKLTIPAAPEPDYTVVTITRYRRDKSGRVRASKPIRKRLKSLRKAAHRAPVAFDQPRKRAQQRAPRRTAKGVK